MNLYPQYKALTNKIIFIAQKKETKSPCLNVFKWTFGVIPPPLAFGNSVTVLIQE